MMQTAWLYVVVFVGGGIGSALRLGVNRAAFALVGPGFPAGTLFVNVAGCLILGAAAGWFAHRDFGIDEPVRLFLATGLLGGFTTFSAFSLDAMVLWERGDIALAAIYVTASVVLSIAALAGGLVLGRVVFGA